MYSLHLSPEQLEIRDTVRDFVARELKPAALKSERLEAQKRPLLLAPLDQVAQLGLRALALSESAGGAGGEKLTHATGLEAPASRDPPTSARLAANPTPSPPPFSRLT